MPIRALGIVSYSGWNVNVPHPPFQGHGADVSPALIQAASGQLDGIVFTIAAAGILIMQEHVAQSEDRRYSLSMLFDVPLQLLNTNTNKVNILNSNELSAGTDFHSSLM